MKQFTFAVLLTLLAGIFLVSSCKKESHVNQNRYTNDPATEAVTDSRSAITKEAPCATCTKNFNLVERQKTLRYREGFNVISALDNNLTAVAKVVRGKASQFVLQDKSGKQYLPQSTRKTTQQSMNARGGYDDIWVICYFTDYGWYCIWIIY